DARPAQIIAERGAPLGKNMALTVAFVKDRIAISPELAAALLPGGAPLAYGVTFRRPELARTIGRFGAEGAKPFYSGDIADKIVRVVQSAGGGLDAKDLAAYLVKERAPLVRTLEGRAVYTMPAPSAGGLMLLETLVMYGANTKSPLAPLGLGSSAYLHT